METMTPEMFGAIFLIGVSCFVVVTLWDWRDQIAAGFHALLSLPRWLFHRYVAVNRLRDAPADDYVESAPEYPGAGATSALPSLEAEVTPAAGSDREAGDAFIYITEKALQSRDEETRRRATIDAYARLEAAGYLAPALAARKATALRRLLFGVSQGRALQRLNEEIDAAKDAAVIPSDLHWQAAAPAPEPSPAARPPIPVADGRLGYVEREEVA